MFAEIIWLKRNDAPLVRAAIVERLGADDRLFGFIESDVVILPGPFDCWLERMGRLIDTDPRMAMLGSLVDADDFVPLDAARAAAPHLTEYEIRDITHHEDPERGRHRPADPEQLIFAPHNPAGRLLLLRTEAVLKAGGATDSDLHERLFELNFTTGISTEIRHRHLSLLNIYDYPHYDMLRRNAYMYSLTYKAQAEEAVLAAAEAAGHITTEPDLHVEADEVRIDGEVEGNIHRFTIPADASSLALVSRRGFVLQSIDRRPLGVAVGRLVIDGRDALSDPALVRGWRQDEGGWRWTSGRAELPPCTTVEVQVVGTVTYSLRPEE